MEEELRRVTAEMVKLRGTERVEGRRYEAEMAAVEEGDNRPRSYHRGG